ncbi:TATA-binding protein-associated factor 172-like [Homarus americanus]|uniref:TATA-binding protein-associated factor 172-like n=1 Tax=Homarus americanus TaxID=6706 RepID=A0A8J5N7C5_HOMAM|nr:TATA-binding protein-associated factor 172-like [Homarus americanus]
MVRVRGRAGVSGLHQSEAEDGRGLDRLFLLLENGGSGVTRQAAAQQLGEVVRLHPHELNSLINRVHVYLSSKSWDVRIAAGLAVEAIVSNVPQWNPQPLQVERGVSEEDCVKPSSGRLSLGTFNISHVLQKGSYLMAADEKLFEAEDENMPLNPADRLACQRRLVNQRLGLDIAEAMGIDTEGIFTNDDLAESPVEGTLINGQGKENVMNIVKKEIKSAELALSSRELNRARRKAKLLAKQKSVDVSECVTDEGPEKKRMRVASMVNQDPAGSDDDERMVVDEGPLGLNLGEEGCEWPLENFCEILATDLFSLAWETRHGAATALRQVIKVHGRGGGKTTYHTKEQMEQNHQAWLEDMAVRLMCVLALDRFGDFVSDQVVAPVRETCAQALGLLDEMDDVVAVAASCLVPVADSVVNLQDKEVVMKLVATLWDALLDIDDLTSSTNSILMLLAKLLAHPGNSDSVRSNLGELVPRLWPFLYHSSSSVRGSALKTLDTLTAYTSPAKVSTDTVPLTSVVKEKSAKESHQIEKSEQKVTKDVEVKIENVEILTSSESINTKVDVENIEHKVSEAEKENNKLLDTERQSDKSVIRIKEEKVVDSVTTKSRDNGILSQVTRDKEDINMESTIKTKKEVNAESLCKEENTEGDQTKQEMVPTKTEETTTAGSICSNKAVSDTESSKEMDVGSVKTTDSSCAWLCSIIQPALTHIYQRALLEKSTENLDMVFKIWRQMLANVSLDYLLPAVCPMVSQWLYLTMANPKVPLDVSVLLIAHHNKSGEGRRLRGSALNDPTDKAEVKFYLGSCDQFSDANNKQKSVIRARCAAAKLLGRLSQYVIKPMPGVEYPPEDTPVMCYVRILLAHLVSQSAVQRLGAGAVVREWASIYPNQECHPQLQSALQTCLTGVAYYDEIAVSFTKLQEETRDFMAMLRHYKLPLDETQAVISGAVVRFRILPRNLNPVIKPLMDSIKKEKNEQLQSLAAEDLTKLLELCIDRPTCPNGKVVKNLASFLCIDQECTPKIPQLNAERQLLRRSSSVTGRGPGRPPGRPPANAKREDPAEVTEAILENENQRLTEIQRRGCTVALQRIAQYFGEDLPQKIPQLWDLICNPFTSPPEGDLTPETSQEAVNWFQLLEVVVPALHTHLVAQLETKLHLLDHWLYHPYCAVRHMATRVMGALACVLTVPTLTYVVESIVPALGAIDNDGKRQGAVECIYAVIDRLGFSVVPYIVLLIVPLLGRMSDPDNSVRHMATYCFATLIRLLPLEGGVPDPPSLSEELLKQKMRERQFLEKLMDPTKIENYKVPVPINAELRSYQQKAGCKRSTPFQSLVVCPPTLTGHWVYEVEKFVKNRYLNPLHYTGPPTERYKLRRFFPDHNLIVASYDIVRNDIEFFSQIRWNYVILDEGHIIKNGKTKSCKAIKQLIAHHRLILSGTPIQNNVLELWSLFDFLMPGFLGTERQFMARYSKPILQSRDAKSSSKEQEAGVLAMEALHRQALPFLLRRDYYCELSPLQEELYEDFARTQASQDINESLRSTDQGKDEQAPKHGHIFQALQYLRKVCNHPKLVLKPRHPEYERISAKLKTCSLSMSDISHSAKLPALKQLLLDCGIGVDSGSVTEAVVSQHRALIFCQLKAMLDIIENDLLKLDGSVPAGSRHALVQRFNGDPSIDLLLLTTQVGGLGLNLIGADTVIFVEHDWNPMRDLQAMDRAHRIGQKRVVNVYRLITRGTLEEKIMGLQKFKMMTANTVISHENSSLLSMGTDQLLDLFTLDSGKGDTGHSNKEFAGGAVTQALGVNAAGAKAVLENLPDLWDQNQYENEYDLDTFMVSLKK